MATVLPEPRIPDLDQVSALRWGVIGSGWIAGMFTKAVHAHTRQRVVAATARDAERLGAFAEEHGIPTTFATPGQLVADPGIDVVYIATPHTSHAELALLAIAAGKHVLVEKPFTMSADEAVTVTEAARSAGVLVMEAMWTRYLPQSDVMRQLLASNAIGDVHTVIADVGFQVPFDADGRMWNPDLGGGILLDAGVYPISFVSSVVGAPTSVVASGCLASTGVDERASLLLTMEPGVTALVSASMVSSHPGRATVIGSGGRIEIASPFIGPSTISLVTGPLDAEETASWTDDRFAVFHDGLSDQATAFASFVDAGYTESPVHPHREIVSVMATIDEARRQIGWRATTEEHDERTH